VEPELLLGPLALAVVSVEWLALGWLSGIHFPGSITSSSHGGRVGPGSGEADRPRRMAPNLWPACAANWALRLLVGACLVAVAQLLLALAGVGFAFVPLVLVLGALGALCVRLALGASAQNCPAKYPALERREQVGWLLLGVLIVAALIRSFVVPESGWDAYSHWGLRAQAFASAGTLVDAHSEHEYYPPLVPLLEAWLYLHRGLVSIDLGKTVWAVVGGAFAVCLAWHLRLSLPSAWPAAYLAAGVVLVTPGLLESFWTGQADLALTVCLALATLAAWQWLRTPNRGWLVQVVIFGVAAALTKFEGLPRVALVCLALLVEALVWRDWRLWRPLLLLLAAAVAGWLVWTAFELGHAIAPNAEHVGAFQPLAISSVLVALLAVFGGIRTGGGLLVAGAACAFSARCWLRPPLRVLALVVVAEALGTLVAFLVSSTSPDLEVLTSATRLVEQFLPLALVVGAVGLAGQATYNRRGR
jgi:hypothetical protein